MIEFENFKQFERYLRKKGQELKKGSNERKNMQMVFEKLGENMAMCSVQIRCPCGYVGDNGSMMAMKRDTKEYKEFKEGKVPKMFCQHCQHLSMSLITNYKMGPEEGHSIMEKVWEVARKK